MATLSEERADLTEVAGIVPGLAEFGQNTCLFASRCHMADEQCFQQRPIEQLFDGQHLSACWHAENV